MNSAKRLRKECKECGERTEYLCPSCGPRTPVRCKECHNEVVHRNLRADRWVRSNTPLPRSASS